ncbi:EpsG family protein [Streptococcus suis]
MNSLAFISWVILFFIYSGNIREGFSDLTHYRNIYYAGQNSLYFKDSGYNFFADLFLSHQLSFQVFLAFIFISSSILMYLVAKKLRCNYNLLIFLLSLFYFFYSLEVLRFFLACSFALLAYYYLSQNCKITFVLLIFVGALFHISILYLLPFVFFYREHTVSKFIYMLIAISVILIAVNLSQGNQSGYLMRIIGLFLGNGASENRIQYYTGQSTRLGFLLYDTYYFFNLLIIKNLMKMLNLIEDVEINVARFLNVIYQQCLYSTIFLPFIMFSTTFTRYLIFTCILSFFAIAMSEPMLSKTYLSTRNALYMYLGVVGATVFWWYLRENVLYFYEALWPNLFN